MKKRIAITMDDSMEERLSFEKQLLQGAAVISKLVLIIIIGAIHPIGRVQAGVTEYWQNPSKARTEPRFSFEVASLKPIKQCGQVYSSGPNEVVRIMNNFSYKPGGRYSGCGTMKDLIREAYKIDYNNQLSGGPGWKDRDLFQIDARAESKSSRDQMRLMLQSLLEERFKLKIHKEVQEIQAYSLVVAEGGPKLQQAKDESGNPIYTLPPREVIEEKKKNAMSGLVDSSQIPSIPGKWSTTVRILPNNDGNNPEMIMQFNGNALTLDKFAEYLTSEVKRKVVNKTGIDGLYDFDLEFSTDTSSNISIRPGGFSSKPSVGAGTEGIIDSIPFTNHPNIFKVLEKQYGLKLIPGKGPSEFYIIDSVEKPSEN